MLSTQSAGFLYRSMRSLTVYMYMSARCLCSEVESQKSSIITAIRSKMKRRRVPVIWLKKYQARGG